LAWPYLGQLRVLHLQTNQLRENDAEALAAVGCLPGLTLLDLRNNRIGPAGVCALQRSPHWQGRAAPQLEANPCAMLSV
jgi:hypothetical protein